MGQDIEPQAFTREDRTSFRRQLHRGMDAFRQMLSESVLEAGSSFTGFEIELNLVDDNGDPALRNAEILRALGDSAFQTELARFNLEVNIAPRRLSDHGLRDFEEDVRTRLEAAAITSREFDTRLMMVGILPTLTTRHMSVETLSPNARYILLNEQIFLARGEDIHIDIDGVDRIMMTSDSVAPEAACTSTQLHIQTSPEAFPAYWNAAQALAGAQVAICANAPFLFGRELWRETRIKLFEQAIDTRSPELRAQGVRPRVWFGERWITSVLDLFEENVRYFSPLLPVCEDEDPLELLERGDTPRLAELRLHNGTIYRWNRPVYDVVEGKPHLRVENRVLPSGPSLQDTLANAAFYFGLTRRLAEEEQPVWNQMSFGAAAENFENGAKYGMDARLYWPGIGTVDAPELVLRRLLPLAREGLDRWGVDAKDSDRLLGIIEQRCALRQNGATWQADMFHRLHDRSTSDRQQALHIMTRHYMENMAANAPVHSWPT
jgi:gamma-glutamyl:cysteine ligase YbdK (ATP-grasp superfamily)